MNQSEKDIDRRLAELARATDAIKPSGGFSARVMAAVAAEEGPGWLDEAFSAARRMLPVAALAAAVGILWAVQTDRTVDGSWAVSDDGIEVDL